MKKLFAPLSIALFMAASVFAQTAKQPGVSWSASPFESKVFIENKGQFNKKDGLNNSQVYFGADILGTTILYTPKGLTYRIDKEELQQEALNEFMKEELANRNKDISENEAKEEMELRKKCYKLHTEMVHMEWLGANPAVQIIPSGLQTEYFNYGFENSKDNVYFARAYQKLLYKNLYPGIDVEYTFHPKTGTKYTIIAHTGADYSKVKMKYTGDGTLKKDAQGNIVISTPLGDIIDHAPETYYENGQKVASWFNVDGNTISFSIDQRSNVLNQKLIIDPWTLNPTFASNNRVLKTDNGTAGDVWLWGSSANFKCRKYNSLGAVQWTYNSPWSNANWFGDLTVDNGNNAYITPATMDIQKLSPAGVVLFTNNAAFYEGFHMEFNSTYTTMVIAGGGGTTKIAYVNMTTGAVTGMVTLNTGAISIEIRSLCLAPNNNWYALTTHGFSGNNPPNKLIGISPALAAIYTQPACHNSTDFPYFTPAYGTGSSPAAGENGIGASCNFVYTYEGKNLCKYNITTGAQIATVVVAGGIASQNSGTLVDSCGNVYVGTSSGVSKYDANLVFVKSAPVAGAVYDISWGPNGGIFAAGDQVVALVDTMVKVCQAGSLNFTSSGSNANCGSNNGSASVSALTGGTNPYTYSWSNGMTTASITGLGAGTYTVTVKDASCPMLTKTATVQVTSGGSGVANILSSNNPLCSGSNTGTASASMTGGTGTLTYSWNPSGQNTSTATGLSAGTYTVTVTDQSGCSATKTVQITAPAALVANTGTTIATCGQSNGTASVTGSGGTGAMTYSWSSGQSTATVTGLSAGTYTVVVADNNGCTKTAAVTVTSSANITSGISNFINTGCNASTGSATASGNGGTGTYSYSWNNGQTTVTATGLSAGTYSVTVTDGNNCTSTTTVTITGGAGPSITNSNPTNVLCNGGLSGVASVTASGGTGTLTYSWNNGQITSSATGLTAGNYTVVVSDVNGCTTTTTFVITEPPVLTVNANGTTSCAGQAATASATGGGGTGAYNYVWNNGQLTQTATGLTNGTYTVVITDANNCTASATALVNANSNPSAVFTGVDTAGCVPLCVTLTNTTGNIQTWSWNFGDGNTGAGSSPKHCYTSPGTYSVTLTVTDNNGCTGTYAKNNWIQVYPQVNAAFTASPQPTTVLNPVIQFTDQSLNATSWSWSFGDILNSTSSQQNPSFNYKDSGCYNVTLIADNQYNCADTSDQQVCILGDYELFAPNAFTPDGSGLNDIWNVKGIGIDPNNFKLWIFDRWGNLIFETSDLYQGWNGKANGGKEIAQQDVYVWKVATKDFIGNKHNYIGHVSLVR